ncbi:MAG: ABC transporter ATP-binding protein, partial [Gemmatimonadaceae bacterium]
MDLREYDLAALQRSTGVIFQDFVRHAFRLGENIGVARIDAPHDDARIREPAARSLADRIAGRVPQGFDRQLGRRFEGVA